MIYTSRTDGGEKDHIIVSEYDGALNLLVTACGIDYIEAPVEKYRSKGDIPNICSNCDEADENGDEFRMRAAIWNVGRQQLDNFHKP